MRAAVIHETDKVVVEDVEIDEPRELEVLVRTVAAGVCHSDLGYVAGTFPRSLPMVLGHESAGVVERVGDRVTHVAPGDHVITYPAPTPFCGRCDNCLTGHAPLCTREGFVARGDDEPSRLSQGGRPLGQMTGLGCFAERMLVHENSLVKIRPEMPLDKAALLGCGVTTGLGASLNTAKITPGSKVAVIGCGGVGLSAIQGARISGALQIVAVDRLPARLELARTVGATDVVDASTGDAVAQVLELTSGGVDFSFEVVGRPETTAEAFGMLKPGGTTTVVGIFFGQTIPISSDLLRAERKLQGSMLGSAPFRVVIPRYVDFYLRGMLMLDEVVTARYPLEEINDALDALTRGEGARSLVTFE